MKSRLFDKLAKKTLASALALTLAASLCACGAKEPVNNNPIDDNYRNYYEIFVYSFCDSDGDGIGDLNGVISKLDYIKELGCNGIWFMPLMEAPSYHKYDTTDYCLIDDEYGTNEDFANLVSEAHERGINIMIDMVINHSSSEHPWFLEACRYLRSLNPDEEPDASVCPYVDYYHFSREQIDKTYSKVAGADWYYESVFYYTQPDLNLASTAVQEEIKKISAFWLELGVDGFRMDAAMHFDETDGQFNKDTLRWLNDYCKSINPDFTMISEVWAGESVIASYYESGTDSFFNFDAAGSEGKILKTAAGSNTMTSFLKAMEQYQTDFGSANPDYIDGVFLTNHDQGRVCNALNSKTENMKMANALMMTMYGSTFIYYGEEIGMKSKGTSDENKRLPMNWSDKDATGECKGPADSDHSVTQNFAGAEEQAKDKKSLLNFYKQSLAFRNNNPELARGTVDLVEDLTSGTFGVAERTYGDSTIVVIYNNATDTVTVDLSVYADRTLGDTLVCVDKGSVKWKNGTITMPAKSIAILR